MARRTGKNRTLGIEHPRDANAAARAFAAFDLICAGYTYEEAAHEAGYASRSSCWTAVQRELARMAFEKTEDYRKMHVRRLQRLRRVYMPKAESGDGWSADRVLRFDEREAALLGIDTAPGVGNVPVVVEVDASLAQAVRGVPALPALPEPPSPEVPS